MSEKYDGNCGPGKGTGWRRISSFKLPDREKVNIWLTVSASPRSFGIGDAWEVPEAWRVKGKWFHIHNGKEMEI